MADDVLKAFVVSLGWKVDREGERRVTETIKGVTLQAGHLATAFGAMALAVSVAVAKVAKSFDTLEFVSRRTGASVQNLRSLQYAFSQIGGSSEQATGAIESFSRSLRTNPGIRKFITDLGVATTEGGKARDSVDVLVDSIDAIRKKNPHYVGSQYAELLGIDEGTYEMLSRQLEEFKAYQAEYGRIAASIGLDNEKAGKAGASFQRSLTSLTTLATTFAQKLLIDLAPALERVAKGLLGWIEARPQEIAEFFASVGRGIDTFTKSVESGDLAKTLENIGNKLFLVGKAIERVISLLAKLGLIGSGDSVLGRVFNHMFGTDKDVTQQVERDLNWEREAERPGLLRRGYDAIRRKIGLSTSESGASGASGARQSGGAPDAEMTSAGPILDLIARAEGTTKRGYNDSFNHQVGGTLTDKTLDEIDSIQSGMKGSSAIGRYQFMRKTLNGLRKEMGLTGQEKFDGALQDRLATRLYQRRMAQAKREGSTRGAILKALAQEWASFPTESGQGYYPGQRASITPEQVMGAVETQQQQAVQPKGTSSVPAYKPQSFPKMEMPGGAMTADRFNSIFNNSAPMGHSTSNATTNDNRSISISNTVNQQGGDGRSDTQRWERAMDRYSGTALRDAQTAIR
ncbi:MAG: hypothetical protein PGN25_05745 [Methylorubrum populi]